MQLEAIETQFTEVLDGVAFTMGFGGTRVIVIVANETLVRLDAPMGGPELEAFLLLWRPEFQRLADAKFCTGQYENRGSRIRLLPRDLTIYRPALALAG